METFAKTTKKKTYIKFGNDLFMTNNDWSNLTFEKVDFSSLDVNQQHAVTTSYGWLQVGNFEKIEDAYYDYVGLLKKEREQRKERSEKWRREIDAENVEKWNAIKDLQIIPATIDNIRIVLTHLSKSNWGGWDLPKLSIGYSAHQYDCDGKTAVTITLDKAVSDKEFGIINERKFVMGAPRGYLNKYQRL